MKKSIALAFLVLAMSVSGLAIEGSTSFENNLSIWDIPYTCSSAGDGCQRINTFSRTGSWSVSIAPNENRRQIETTQLTNETWVGYIYIDYFNAENATDIEFIKISDTNTHPPYLYLRLNESNVGPGKEYQFDTWHRIEIDLGDDPHAGERGQEEFEIAVNDNGGSTDPYESQVYLDDFEWSPPSSLKFDSLSLPNGTVRYRNYSIAELDFTTTTTAEGFDDYDLNLMVKRPQYSGFQRETSFVNVPSGTITTLYSVNASAQNRSEYPNGEYRYRWYAGDCPETPTCSGAGDTLYNASDLRTMELRDFDEPVFNILEPIEGSGEIGFTEQFQFYISSQGTGNVSVVVDDDRVVNTTKSTGGSVLFNESYTHSALGGHTWYPRIDVLYNGDTRTFTGDSQTYTLFAESAVNIALVAPGDGDTVQDSYSLITDVDSNVAGEISIVVDGQERTTCPHDGDGVVTCSIDSSELSLSTGEHTWRVFLFTDAGEQFSSSQQTFVKSIEGDQESEIDALFPDDGELFNVVRPIDIGAAVESNAGGYLSVEINNETVPHTYNGDLRNETRYSGGDREEFRFAVDSSEFYDGASSYEWRVVFDGDIDQHSNETEERMFSMLQGIVDYDLIQPESGEVLWIGNSSAVSVVDSFGLEVDILYRMFSTPNGTVTEDPFLPHIYEHRVFLDGDLVNIVNQSTSGWTTRIQTTSSIEEGEHQWWVETYNLSSGNLVDRSPVQEFTIRRTPSPETIGQQILDFILLRDLSFTSRFLIGSIIVLTLSTVLSLLLGSPIIFFLVMLFGLMFGGSISPPWFPTWLLVLFALLGGAIVYWWVTNN